VAGIHLFGKIGASEPTLAKELSNRSRECGRYARAVVALVGLLCLPWSFLPLTAQSTRSMINGIVTTTQPFFAEILISIRATSSEMLHVSR
jgi:hypothetical protein